MNRKRGFSIIELCMVIAVIAILAAVLIPTFTSVIDSAHSKSAISSGKSYFEEMFALDYADGVIDEKDALNGTTDEDHKITTGEDHKWKKNDACTYKVDNPGTPNATITFTYTQEGHTATYVVTPGSNEQSNWTVS